MQRFCLTLSLRPDPVLVAEYVEHHRQVWPAVQESLHAAGVLDMQIFLKGEQLFMVMDTRDDFTFERKARMDRANAAVMEWESLMARFQSVDERSDPAGRWQLMEQIFQLR